MENVKQAHKNLP